MEGRKDPTGPDIPASPVYNHNTAAPYMDDLLQGLVNAGRSSSGGANSQVNFPPWSPYGEGDQYQQSAFSGWNAFGPTINLAENAGSHIPQPPFQGYEEYVRSLGQHDITAPESVPCTDGLYRVYSDTQGGLLGGQNVDIAVESGRNLYAEALHQLNNFTGKEYEPFGMTNVFNPPVEAELDVQETVAGPESPAAPSCSSSSKPSYSEVIRNNPSGSHPCQQASGSSKSKQNLSFPSTEDTKFPDFASPTPHARNPSKKPKSSSWSHGTTTKHQATGSEVPSPTTVKPNSKMGLDQFEDVSAVQERYRRSLTGDEASNPRSRKGSTSSIGSGSSGMDDFAYFIHGRGGYPFPTREGSPSSGTCDNSSCDGTGSEKLDLSGEVPIAAGVKAKVKASRRLSRPRAGSPPTPVPEKISSKKCNTPSPSTDKPAPDEHAKKGIFFDPKRIFSEKEPKSANPKPRPNQSKSPRGSEGNIPNNQNPGQPNDKCATNVLNNGKPKYNFMYTTNNHGKPTTTHYINNDLRQPAKKMTNTEGRNSPNRAPSKSTNTHRNSESQTDADDSTDAQQDTRPQPPPSAFSTGRRKPEGPGKKGTESRPHGKRARRHREHSSMVKGELFEHSWEWCKWAFSEVTHHVINVLLLVLKVALALLAVALSGVVSGCCRLWSWMRLKIPFLRTSPSADDGESFDWSNPNTNSRFKSVGLEKNIPLPTTGEEAMKRLLACKGKDPYSILGVRSDSSDEEIKKYYRKQAVLVHPDKNKIPGAEEAFKILGHSFELIGEPEKRSKYDAQRLETQETETAMHEFADLLSKLHNKMQEAANLMRCELCGGKHRRVPTERPWYNARYCDRCNVRHSAKEGDVWAESRVMGFLWHYYACMEGKIYDITEWASCQRGNFKHIQANAHHVIYRIATQAGARQRAQSNSGRGNNEADLEDFINHLFQRAGCSDSNGGDSCQTASGPSGAPAPNSAAKKRRKKKKH